MRHVAGHCSTLADVIGSNPFFGRRFLIHGEIHPSTASMRPARGYRCFPRCPMPTRRLFAFLLLAITVLVVFWSGPRVRAQATATAAITGRVSSADAGAMEGVYVSAKMTGSPVTVSVMTDSAGRYTFPRSRL